MICDSYLYPWRGVVGSENYNQHWPYIPVRGKVVLDFGADWGSTALYFLKKGAAVVVAVEADLGLYKKLEATSQNKNIIPIYEYVNSPTQIESLINDVEPDICKFDIEGQEVNVMKMAPEVILKVPFWAFETHTHQIYDDLRAFMLSLGFKIQLDYPFPFRNLRVIYFSL